EARADDLAGPAGGAGGLHAVPEAVDTGHERAPPQDVDAREISARRVAAAAPLRHAPFDRFARCPLTHGGVAPRGDARAHHGTSTSSSSRSCRSPRRTRGRTRP